MRLYLVRHGDASDGPDDALRPLSTKGSQESARTGVFLKRARFEPVAVWHSGLLRSRQTAEIIADLLECRDRLRMKKGLAPNDDAASFAEEMNLIDGDHLAVGHLPFLARLACCLLTGKPDAFGLAVPTASFLVLERESPRGWTLKSLISPKFMKPKN